MISLDLNTNDSEVLLRHCMAFKASSGDVREDRRLESALEELAEALKAHLASNNADRVDGE